MPTDTGLGKTALTARLDGETLVIGRAQPFGGMPGNVEARITETWRLSADGKALTLTTRRETPAKAQTFTEVFARR